MIDRADVLGYRIYLLCLISNYYVKCDSVDVYYLDILLLKNVPINDDSAAKKDPLRILCVEHFCGSI